MKVALIICLLLFILFVYVQTHKTKAFVISPYDRLKIYKNVLEIINKRIQTDRTACLCNIFDDMGNEHNLRCGKKEFFKTFPEITEELNKSEAHLSFLKKYGYSNFWFEGKDTKSRKQLIENCILNVEKKLNINFTY